jgi:hypothetical protein
LHNHSRHNILYLGLYIYMIRQKCCISSQDITTTWKAMRQWPVRILFAHLGAAYSAQLLKKHALQTGSSMLITTVALPILAPQPIASYLSFSSHGVISQKQGLDPSHRSHTLRSGRSLITSSLLWPHSFLLHGQHHADVVASSAFHMTLPLCWAVPSQTIEQGRGRGIRLYKA